MNNQPQNTPGTDTQADINAAPNNTPATTDHADDVNLHEVMAEADEDKRPTIVVGGLVLGIVLWIATYFFPDASVQTLRMWLILFTIAAAGALAMSIAGRRRAPSLARVAMLVTGSLTLFLLIALAMSLLF